MIIKGKKINLIPFKKRDIINKQYISWLRNKKLLQFSNQRFKKNSLKDLKKFYISLKKRNDFFYKIFTKNDQFIGTIICRIEKKHNTGNLGILIGNQKFKSKGFGLDAWTTALNFLIKKSKIRKIYAGTLTCNKPMLKIFINSKMIFEARFKKHEKVNNKYYDTVFYATYKK